MLLKYSTYWKFVLLLIWWCYHVSYMYLSLTEVTLDSALKRPLRLQPGRVFRAPFVENGKQKWSILVTPVFLFIAMLRLLILLDTISILLRYTTKKTGKCRRIMLLNTNTLPVSNLCLLLVLFKISIKPLLSFKM